MDLFVDEEKESRFLVFLGLHWEISSPETCSDTHRIRDPLQFDTSVLELNFNVYLTAQV